MKRFLCLLLALLCTVGCAGAAFSDVTESTPGYEAITVLSQQGILTGFPDGTFRPDAPITRAECAAVIVRLAGYDVDETASIYSDVAGDFWGKPYIMAATREGILNGMGGGKFAPQDSVTYSQILKMLVCVLDGEKLAQEKGGWPVGYLDAALELKIVNSLQHYIVSTVLDWPAPRGDVAKYAYAALEQLASSSVTVGGRSYGLGQSAANLPAPEETQPSTAGFVWHIYGISDYQNFHAVGVKDGKIVAVGAEGLGFSFNGYRAGDVMPEKTELTKALCYDKNDDNRIHGVLLLEDDMWRYYSEDTSAAALYGESRVNFHCTNAFRVMHGKAALRWSEPCATVARLHSQDMADRDYFQHDSLDGRKFYDRLVAYGLSYVRCAENICGGQSLSFSMNDGWVNSAGHRKNILGATTQLGVGGGYNDSSKYKIYFTQDFYTPD